MTAKLAQAATEARYLFQVYCQFQKPIPQHMLVKCCADLVEGLEEYHAATGKNSVPANPVQSNWVNGERGELIDIAEWSSQ